MHTRRIVFLIFILSSFLTRVSSQHLKVESWYDTQKNILKESYYVLKKSPTVQDSSYISYYHNGKIKSKGNFSRNKANGNWEYFYENGVLKMKGELKENVPHGYWEYFYESGTITMKGNILQGMREGEWEFFYENSNMKTIGKYQKNQKEGLWRYFHEDGSFKAQAEFTKDKGKYKEFFPTGIVKSEGEIIGGKSNGHWKYYYDNGQLKAEGEEKNGMKEGFWKYYFKEGKIASEGNYLKGMEDGKWKYYHENGSISSEGDIKEGQKEGYWKLYYKDGAFKGEGNFKQGDGFYKEYYESGKLKVDGSIKKGKNEGEWKYYYESGIKEGECFFTDGKGYYRGYYENGKMKMEGTIENGNKVGIWKLYNEAGELAGYYKTYYEDEVPVFVPLEDAKTPGKDSIKPIIKPIVKLPKKRSRHYTYKVNEYRDFILSFQPLGLLRHKFPVSLEYYIQERLGLEINYTVLRDPIFKAASSIATNEVFKSGFSAYFKQKLYSKDQDNGMLYWAQEIRFTSLDYLVKHQDTTGTSLLQANEKLYEFSILFGDRLLRDSRKKGWTIDVFGGLGIGYRSIDRNYQSTAVKDALFLGLKTRSFTIPLRLGLSVGYLF